MGRRAIDRRGLGGLAVIGVGTLAVPLDSMVNVAFPAIVAAFGMPVPMIQWVVISYVLTHAGLMLVFGRLGDMFGHRRIFMLGSLVSMVAFAGCALAPGFAWLLGARVLQGIGAALLLSCGAALATGMFAERERSRALGLYTMFFGLGGALGPAAAGLLVEAWGWQAVYAVRAPICLLAFVLSFRLPSPPRRSGNESFDALGALWLVMSIAAALLAISRLADIANQVWLVLGLAITTCAAGTAFVRLETRVAQPIIDVSFFRDRFFARINLGHVLMSLSGFSVMLLVPFQLSRIGGLAAPAIGLVLMASSLGMMLAAPLAGRLAQDVSRVHLMVAGALAAATGLAAVGLLAAHGSIAITAMAAAMALQGVGQGLYQVGYADVVVATLPLHARGVAGSLTMMTRTVGVVTGAATLMFAFQTMQAFGGEAAEAAFAFGFRATFLLAAAIAGTVALGLWPRRQPA